jgi:hypothetical protein
MGTSNDVYNAAPYMLDALRLTLKRLTELRRDDESGIRVVIANAIAKAEGREPSPQA